MKVVKLTKVKTVVGAPFRVPGDDGKIEECTDLCHLLRLLIFNLPRQMLTMEDSVKACKLIPILDNNRSGSLELEDADYEWLLAKINAAAPMVFGINAKLVKDAFETLKEEDKGK